MKALDILDLPPAQWNKAVEGLENSQDIISELDSLAERAAALSRFIYWSHNTKHLAPSKAESARVAVRKVLGYTYPESGPNLNNIL